MLSKKNLMVTMVTDVFLKKTHNFTKICGHHWIHLVFLIPEIYTFVQVFLVMRCIRTHISFFRLGLTPTLSLKMNTSKTPHGARGSWSHLFCVCFCVCGRQTRKTPANLQIYNPQFEPHRCRRRLHGGIIEEHLGTFEAVFLLFMKYILADVDFFAVHRSTSADACLAFTTTLRVANFFARNGDSHAKD